MFAVSGAAVRAVGGPAGPPGAALTSPPAVWLQREDRVTLATDDRHNESRRQRDEDEDRRDNDNRRQRLGAVSRSYHVHKTTHSHSLAGMSTTSSQKRVFPKTSLSYSKKWTSVSICSFSAQV